MRFYQTVWCVMFMVNVAMADTISVKPDGSGDFPTIQSAIDAAATSGDIISLHNGIFTGADNRDLVTLGKELTILSFSGDADSCVINCEGTDVENHRGFNFGAADSNVVLENFSITGGYVTGVYPAGNGGAILSLEGSPTVEGVIFKNNHASNGGAVYNVYSSSTYDACTFSFNTSVTSTGAFGSWGSTEHLYSCFFDHNSASNAGGFACYGPAAPTLEYCTFSENGAQSGGAILVSQGSTITCISCVFVDNNAISGGAVYMYPGTTADFNSCSFNTNEAENNGGGLVVNENAHVDLMNCDFTDNSADNIGGGIHIVQASGTVEGCTFDQNSAGFQGGGAYLEESSTTISQSTFVNNDGNFGSAICVYWQDAADSTNISNTIVAFNTGGWPVASVEDLPFGTINCTDIYGNTGGDWEGVIASQTGLMGNISLDPLFCDAPGDNFSIRSDSPCAPFSGPNTECDLAGAHDVGCTPPSAIEGGSSVSVLSILEAGPNPFISNTTLRFSVARPGAVKLRIFDATGRQVRSLVNMMLVPGQYVIPWDGKSESGEETGTGVYYGQLHLEGADDQSQTQKLIRLQ
jgi:Chlamydia polymorphic membrane protein (Chlamydia_PMP) repeat